MRSSIVVFVLVFAVFGLLLGYAASDVSRQGNGGPALSGADNNNDDNNNGTQNGGGQTLTGNSTANSTAQSKP